MKPLKVISVRSGDVIDTVTLADGELRFATGAAREMFESLRSVDPSLTDAAIFAMRTDWSNGYIQTRSD